MTAAALRRVARVGGRHDAAGIECGGIDPAATEVLGAERAMVRYGVRVGAEEGSAGQTEENGRRRVGWLGPESMVATMAAKHGTQNDCVEA